MMSKMMLLSAELRLKRNVRMRHLATPPTPSAPSGPRKFAVSPRSQSRSTPPSLDVQRNLLNCVPLLAVDSSRDQRSVMTKSKLLFKMLPRKTVTLSPQRTCKHVTKLVPKLTPTEECVDVPKEVCTRSRTNPRAVKKPVVKKWCYVPTEESGLA